MLDRVLGTKRELESYFGSRLPPEKKNLFLRLYGDADLFFQFGQGTTRNQRRNVLPVAFDNLLALPKGASDEVLKNDPGLFADPDFGLDFSWSRGTTLRLRFVCKDGQP